MAELPVLPPPTADEADRAPTRQPPALAPSASASASVSVSAQQTPTGRRATFTAKSLPPIIFSTGTAIANFGSSASKFISSLAVPSPLSSQSSGQSAQTAIQSSAQTAVLSAQSSTHTAILPADKRKNAGSRRSLQDDDDAEENHNRKALTANFRQKLYVLLEMPSHSYFAIFFNLFIILLILFSGVLMCVHSLPEYYAHKDYENVWLTVELVIMSIFTIEFILRTVAHSATKQSLWKFLLSPLTFFDILAFLPYYLELIIARQATFEFGRFTILRLFRVFRLMRIFRHVKQVEYMQLSMEVAYISIVKSLSALFPLFLTIMVMTVVLATFIYYVERGKFDKEIGHWVALNGERSEFDSIPTSFWFIIATVTTTGYGDTVPLTTWGKFLAFMSMMCGVLLIALPSIIIGRNFETVWTSMKPTAHAPKWLQDLETKKGAYHSLKAGEDGDAGEVHEMKDIQKANITARTSIDTTSLSPNSPNIQHTFGTINEESGSLMDAYNTAKDSGNFSPLLQIIQSQNQLIQALLSDRLSKDVDE